MTRKTNLFHPFWNQPMVINWNISTRLQECLKNGNCESATNFLNIQTMVALLKLQRALTYVSVQVMDEIGRFGKKLLIIPCTKRSFCHMKLAIFRLYKALREPCWRWP